MNARQMVDEIERLRDELADVSQRNEFNARMVCGLRAELAAAKAEPPRPVAIMANPDGDVHAFEYMPDYHATPQPCGSWGYTLRSWTWHPKSP